MHISVYISYDRIDCYSNGSRPCRKDMIRGGDDNPVVELLTRYRKVKGSIPARSRGRNLFSMVNFLC